MVFEKVKSILVNPFNRSSQPESVKQAVLLQTLHTNDRSDDDNAFKEANIANYDNNHCETFEEIIRELFRNYAVSYDAQKGGFSVNKADLNLNMSGVAVALSIVNRNSFVSEKYARMVLQPRLRKLIAMAELQISPAAYQNGASTLFEAFKYYGSIAIEDSIEGKKARLNKTITSIKQSSVSVGDIKK